MEDVTTTKAERRIDRLDAALRAAFGASIAGMSTREDGTVRVHFIDIPAPDEEALALEVVALHGALQLSADKAQIAADGVDTATITVNDPAIAGEASVNYTVWLDGEVYADGSAPVTAGVATLELSSDPAGTFVIEVARAAPNAHHTGYVTIEAVE